MAQIGPSFFRRLGVDPLCCILAFLDIQSLCRLDTAATDTYDRQLFWLPALRRIDNALFEEELESRGKIGWMLLRG